MISRKNSLPFCDIAHLTSSQTMAFALDLRGALDEEVKNRTSSSNIEDFTAYKAALKPVKAERSCTVAKCIAVDDAIQEAFSVKLSIQKKIEKMLSSEGPIARQLAIVEEDMNVVKKEGIELTKVLATLSQKEKKEVKEKMLTVQATGKALEVQIFNCETELRRLQRIVQERRFGGSVRTNNNNSFLEEALPWHSSSNMVVKPNSETKGPKKHTGAFRHGEHRNEEVWSCCLLEEKDAIGCGDDHSIDLRIQHTLKPRDTYHPYTSNQIIAGPTTHKRQQLFLRNSNSFTRDSSSPFNSNHYEYTQFPDLSPESPNPSYSKKPLENSIFSNLIATSNSNNNRSHNRSHEDPQQAYSPTTPKKSSGYMSKLMSTQDPEGSAYFNTLRTMDTDVNSIHALRKHGGTLNAASFLELNRATSTMGPVGKVMQRKGVLSSVRNRPLTAYDGPHLRTASTVSPSSWANIT